MSDKWFCRTLSYGLGVMGLVGSIGSGSMCAQQQPTTGCGLFFLSSLLLVLAINIGRK